MTASNPPSTKASIHLARTKPSRRKICCAQLIGQPNLWETFSNMHHSPKHRHKQKGHKTKLYR